MTLSCHDKTNCHVLLSTSIGTTFQVSSSANKNMNFDWYQEESLGYISNALFMDYNNDNHDNERPFWDDNDDKLRIIITLLGNQKMMMMESCIYIQSTNKKDLYNVISILLLIKN